ncbi:hypothetical protein RhiirA5_398255 [Rhizophagus irregularis]|uniref:F-box domain-containing protein n=3 Tax=Rhizophagus irregularis TaxID=588596 RepID=U9U4L3_RHIID|nr:hypothetical protein GLOIN_2v1480236 [Rhizophagus irregularis DAOM 181602=DAOM 197198]EXX57646.1 hypothetical protein RirG_205230 [Rhizophagus irregularis DAOM 197198w]PKC10218.1 hypothetical protein RhiirA5_398255 [Rhizophagus irregularis]PKC67347.1 hypothetical protein RhiirA1_441247 [Rhizophagus irregularis]PKY21669.1 hypothetical protein RhiirB3_525198 [Rhizophagus irregularis]POG69205.1 hypothetical protein GLOIN_2v1480236 [Rhizophagus irregularis DAOM 181602=DAOM 197198]|eukprot:XP_025176071.1 hypothetical protein GLOIN_2v1480236 [Rhizophagus irregularis DAOM 181602=DAOM 197198]
MYFFQSLEEEIMINIFKYIERPMNLILTCQKWSNVARNSRAKAEWLITQHGKIHALFYAVGLGPTFVNVDVCEVLITERKVVISECFIRKLLDHFGTLDQKLIELKMEHNVEPFEFGTSSWASDLPLSVFTYLITKGYDNASRDLTLNLGDMELFHNCNISGGRENQYLNIANFPFIE